jgi:hypothetical protein
MLVCIGQRREQARSQFVAVPASLSLLICARVEIVVPNRLRRIPLDLDFAFMVNERRGLRFGGGQSRGNES